MLSSKIAFPLLLSTAFTLLPADCLAATPAPAPIVVSYNMAKPAQVSLNLYAPDGSVVREMLSAQLQTAGPHQLNWDGLDAEGNPVPAGNYNWKLLETQGLKAEYLTSLGTNPIPAWSDWPGNHGAVGAVAVDESGAYFVGGCGENTALMIKHSVTDEKKIWEIPRWLDAWGGGSALDVADGKVWMFTGGAVWRIDAATGKPEVKWSTAYDAKGGPDPNPLDWASHPEDMAAGHGQVVVSYANHDCVRWYDADGKALRDITIAAPLGVAVAAEGTVLIISKDNVYSVAPGTTTPVAVIKTNLSGAYRLSSDPKSGDIFVAERGKEPWGHTVSTQQVKRFDKTGKFLHAYGTPGGREWNGRYDPTGFAMIDDIAADGTGGFYIAEGSTAPRRTAHFDGDGKLLREWYGGQMYANFGAADPEDPSLVWIDSQFGTLIQAKVDYAAKTWKVLATYGFAGAAEGLVQNTYHGGGRWFPRHHNGQLYLCREQNIEVLRVDEASRKLVPVAVAKQNIVVPWNADPWGGAPQWFKDALNNEIRTPMHSYMWTDNDGDGKPSKEEMNFSPFNESQSGLNVDEDMTYYLSRTAWPSKVSSVYRMKVQSWTADGRPVYPAWDKAEKLTDIPANGGGGFFSRAADGTLFGAGNTEPHGKFGLGWWGARTGGNRVTKWDANGKSLWTVGRHAAASLAKPGEGKYFWRLTGSTHGCVVITDVENSGQPVWDQDGLWVGRLLDNPDLNAAPASAYTLSGENFGGSLATEPKTGTVYFYGSGSNNTPVYKITGWDDFKRQQGQITVTPAQARSLQAAIAAAAARPDIAHIASLPDTFKLDGDLKKWAAVKPLVIMDGDEVRAKVYLGWNGAGLIAAFDVNTPAPWKNAATSTLAFQGGASVALSLGSLLPDRKTAAPGDSRIVVAPIGGAATRFLFMPLVPADQTQTKTTVQPVYETGNGKISFERVETGSGGAVMVPHNLKPDPDGQEAPNPGYVVEFLVPPDWLPQLLQRNQSLRLDASVQTSNDQGTKTTSRLPWHSKDPSDMATDDVYYESLLRPANWSEARVE